MAQEKRTILIVDDDLDNLKMLKRMLEFEKHEAVTCESGEEALKKIDRVEPDLVLLDINMPGLSGLETLQRLRSKKEYVAVIFVSANAKTEDIVRGLDVGADDYIRKPYEVTEILARVRAQLRIKDLQDQLKAANRKLQLLVEIDDLTGLFNMRSLYQKLDHELSRARRQNHRTAVVMMDLDHFKSANDDHDHLFGSYILTQVGKIISQNIRNIDFGVRYGGDEFLIVLTATTAEGSRFFAERLRKIMSDTVFESDSYTKKLTASLGVAICPPNIQMDARRLVRLADQALYRAKEAGRNQTIIHDLEQGLEPQS